MKVHHVQLVCVFSALCGGNFGLLRAGATIWTGATGQNGALTCPLPPSGNVKFLCRYECQEGNVLIKTPNVTAVSGRYNLEFTSGSGQEYVTITFTRLTQTDAGIYRFGLGTSLFPDNYCDVEIRVADAPLNITYGFILTYRAGQTARYPCQGAASGNTTFLCKNSCDAPENVLVDTANGTAQHGRHSLVSVQGSLFVIIASVTVADSGRYQCGYGRPSNSAGSFLALVVDAAVVSTVTPPVLLPLVASSFLVAALLGTSVFFFYKWKKQRSLIQKASDPKDAVDTNGVAVIYQNHYQSIDRATRDQDYATIKS